MLFLYYILYLLKEILLKIHFCRLMMSSRRISPALQCGVSSASLQQVLLLRSVLTTTLQVSSQHIKITLSNTVLLFLYHFFYFFNFLYCTVSVSHNHNFCFPLLVEFLRSVSLSCSRLVTPQSCVTDPHLSARSYFSNMSLIKVRKFISLWDFKYIIVVEKLTSC